MTKEQINEIDNARSILKSHGYYVSNLWHIADVQGRHDCSDEEAYEILDTAMQNEATYEQIWMSIDSSIESFTS